MAIQDGSANAAFAVSDKQVLLGVVTDGDIRRALLKGYSLSDPVAPFLRMNPVVASESDSRSVVLDLMRSRGISQVPVVSATGRLLSVHLMSELLGRIDRPNVAVVMAGGRGVFPIAARRIHTRGGGVRRNVRRGGRRGAFG